LQYISASNLRQHRWIIFFGETKFYASVDDLRESHFFFHWGHKVTPARLRRFGGPNCDIRPPGVRICSVREQSKTADFYLQKEYYGAYYCATLITGFAAVISWIR
jgi:hypothetical protein